MSDQNAAKKIFPVKRIIIMSMVFLFFIPMVYSKSFKAAKEPENMGPPVNSSANDFAPALGPDGSYMIFNSSRRGKYQDLYISYKKNGKWSEPELLDTLNSPYNDETPFLSADGSLLIFSSDRDGSVEMPRNSRGQIRVSFDLYWSRKSGDLWSTPRPLPGAVNTRSHEKSPALSKDGKTLFYTTWPFGNIQKTETRKARLVNGSFQKSELMPPPFNSGYKDLALIPAEDLGGFFFSSARPEGYGKWDLYFVAFKNGKFADPVNLGKKINTSESEIFLSRLDQEFFICSSRKGGQGLFDIYSSFIFKEEANFSTRAIHFDYNSAKIKEESHSYLDALYDFIKDRRDIKLEIIGHTDLHGSDEFNRKLSIKRARSVKVYLTKKGFDRKRMQIKGAGKSRPVVNNTGPGFDEQNRRTEFKIHKKE